MDPEQAGFAPFVWRGSPAAEANITVTWKLSQDSVDWTMPARPPDAPGEAAAADAGDGR
jgi:hypothetical protein